MDAATITRHTMLHENIKKLIEGFRYDAHPDGHVPERASARCRRSIRTPRTSSTPASAGCRRVRLIAKVPSIAAYAYRHTIGRPYVLPDNELSFTGNFLNMLFKMTEPQYKPHPVLERALDVLFILHADHEQNCSTSAMRGIGSSHADPYSVAGGRGGGALRSAARRRERGGAADARGNRLDRATSRSSSSA